MQPNLAMCHVNSADIMPMWSVHAMSHDDIIPGVHNMHAQVSQVSLCNFDVP